MNKASFRNPTFQYFVLLTLLLTAAYFMYCYRIDAYGLYLWDEARNAVSAVEMSKNGNYIVRHFDGKPDDWELKPPLLTWLQIASAKVVGWNVLATRLPSALAAIGCVWMVFAFAARQAQSVWAGLFSASILLCSYGFAGPHIARTGDHDALLVCWMTAYLVVFYQFLSEQQTGRYLFIFMALLLSAAVLTKSVVGLFYLPGMLLYTLISRNAKRLFVRKDLYIGIVLFIVLVGSYYLMREWMQPGYLSLVWQGELFPRYTNSNHRFAEADWTYYINGFKEGRFFPWIYALIPLTACALLSRQKSIRHAALYVLCTLLPLFVIISTGTVNVWYDAPLYPLMGLLAGLGAYVVYDFTATRQKVAAWLYAALLMAVFAYTYRIVFNKVMAMQKITYGPCLYYESFQQFTQHQGIKSPIHAWHNRPDAHNAHLLFYALTLPEKIIYLNAPDAYKPGMQILSCDGYSIQQLQQHYDVEIITSYKACSLLLLKEKN